MKTFEQDRCLFGQHAAGYPDFRYFGRYFGTDADGSKVIEYPGAHGTLRDFNGDVIGTARIVAAWPTPRSHVSSRMFQIECAIDGVTYTGRGAGHGMSWRGKVKKSR